MHCIGIDLGTTNSLVSYWDETEGKVKLIPNEFGDTLTPLERQRLDEPSMVYLENNA